MRDKLAERLSLQGYRVERAPRESVEELILDKIVEEALEVWENPTLEEIADLYEILNALLEEKGYTWTQVREAAEEKRTRRGGFTQYWILCLEAER